MSSAICFILDQSKILLSGNGLNHYSVNLKIKKKTPEIIQVSIYEECLFRVMIILAFDTCRSGSDTSEQSLSAIGQEICQTFVYKVFLCCRHPISFSL